MGGCFDKWVNGWMEEQIDGRMKDGQILKWMNGWMEEQIDGRMKMDKY